MAWLVMVGQTLERDGNWWQLREYRTEAAAQQEATNQANTYPGKVFTVFEAVPRWRCSVPIGDAAMVKVEEEHDA